MDANLLSTPMRTLRAAALTFNFMNKHLVILAAIPCLLLAPASFGREFKPGDSILDEPTHKLNGPQANAPRRWWAPQAAGGKGTFEFSPAADAGANGFVATQRADTPARMQVGAVAVAGPDLAPLWGRPIRVHAEVRGNITALGEQGEGAVLSLELGDAGRGDRFVLGPKQSQSKPGAKPKITPSLGEFPWTSLEAVFRLPKFTTKINPLLYLMNSAGELQWRDIRLEVVADDTPVTVNLPDFPDPEVAKAATLERWQKRHESERARAREVVGIKEGDVLYTVKPGVESMRPRLFTAGGVSIEELRRRAAMPAYADTVAEIRGEARRWREFAPPATLVLTNEDPARPYSDVFPWMALAYILAETDEERASNLAGIEKWLAQWEKWGLPESNLPRAHQTLSLCQTYDWLHSELPPELRERIRTRIIELVRGHLDDGKEYFTMFRTYWLANHNWFQMAARGTAALTLWGDESAPLQPGELKSWLDEAVFNYTVVHDTHLPDGSAIEGYLYQDYGLRPWMDFAVVSDQLLETKKPFLRDPAIHALASRLFLALPAGAGWTTFNDARPRNSAMRGAGAYRLIASTFKDPRAQLVAELIETDGRDASNREAHSDATLPAHARPATIKPGATPELVRAESLALPAGVGLEDRPGTLGQAAVNFNQKGQRIEAVFDLPEAGDYHVVLSYASGVAPILALDVNGKVPFREASYWPLWTTGGWGREGNQFKPVLAGHPGSDGAFVPWVLSLPAGVSKVGLTVLEKGGANLNYVALIPADKDLSAGLAALGDTAGLANIDLPRGTINWRNLFWFDPAVPLPDPAKLSRDWDGADFGLYSSRSSWEHDAAYFALRAGPWSGETTLERWGLPPVVSGHMYPEMGNIHLYVGKDALLPGLDYAKIKDTWQHNLVVFDGVGTEQGKLIGQLGSGVPWFGMSGTVKEYSRPARVASIARTPEHTTYVADLGGVYHVKDDRVDGKAFKPDYWRGVTFAPGGHVVIVDRVRTPVPRTSRFRLLTLARDLKLDGDTFTGTNGNLSFTIRDVSPTEPSAPVRESKTETMNTHGENFRNVVQLTRADATEAVYAAVISWGEGLKTKPTVRFTESGYTIEGLPGDPVSVTWPTTPPGPPDVKAAAEAAVALP